MPEEGSKLITRVPCPENEYIRLIPDFKFFMICEKENDGKIERHTHLDYEAIIFEHGSYSCFINGKWMKLAPGEGVLLKPGDIHEDRFGCTTRYYGICFSTGTHVGKISKPFEIFRHGINPEEQKFSCNIAAVKNILSAIDKESIFPDIFSSLAQDSQLLLLMRLILRSIPQHALNPEFITDKIVPDSLRARLLALFHDNIHRDLSISEMADALELSASTITHGCKRYLGMSPRQAFLKEKMERAMSILAGSSCTVKDVAEMLGYSNPYVFSRTFKQVRGISPDIWRKNTLC